MIFYVTLSESSLVEEAKSESQVPVEGDVDEIGTKTKTFDISLARKEISIFSGKEKPDAGELIKEVIAVGEL